MASTYLQRTAGTSTENYKYTFSAWVKRTGVLGSSSVNEVLFSNWSNDTNSAYIRFEDQNDNLQVFDKYGSTIDLNYQTNMKFRDCNSFYHIVVNVDGTRSANQRCKIYVNGSEVSCSNTTDTGGTLAMKTVTATNAMRAGAIKTSGGTEYYFSGILSHVHYIDGTGYDASYFGETDSTTGEWKIKTSPTGITYGTNGFFILKDGNTITDQSSNSNDFTLGAGTLTKTEDCPSNVFATFNPLHPGLTLFSNVNFLNGNTTFDNNETGGSIYPIAKSTLAASQGKYYAEFKQNESDGGLGISDGKSDENFLGDNTSNGVHYRSDGNVRVNNAESSFGDTYTTGDIIGIAMDLDNNYVYFSKNGTWQDSGDPTSGASGTGGISIPTSSTGVFHFAATEIGSSSTSNMSANFGNGYFGTTAVASAGTNASGNGIFEFDVPNGFTALSTKGLNL